MHKLLVNRLLKPAQEKVWLSERTVAVDMGRKATKKKKIQLFGLIFRTWVILSFVQKIGQMLKTSKT